MDGVTMAIETQKFTKEERIQQLKDACDSIKENAADFIGNEEFAMNWKISIVLNCHEFPCLLLERESIPSVALKKFINK